MFYLYHGYLLLLLLLFWVVVCFVNFYFVSMTRVLVPGNGLLTCITVVVVILAKSQLFSHSDMCKMPVIVTI